MPERKRRVTPARVAKPETASLSPEDHAQAASALASMIATWRARKADVGDGDYPLDTKA